MRLTGIFNYEIAYSLYYGNAKMDEKKTITMKNCFSRSHALDRFNIYIYGTIDSSVDVYIHEIKLVD